MFNFMMKKLLASKMKDVPQDQQEKIFSLLQKNPQLFQSIAAKAQEKMKQGMSQMDAVMAVAKEHEAELKEAMK
ncbi:MAG: hypothetical protein WC761_04015 [Candidatus Paceibacterota bacterium]|jgi:hypothetical protein